MEQAASCQVQRGGLASRHSGFREEEGMKSSGIYGRLTEGRRKQGEKQKLVGGSIGTTDVRFRVVSSADQPEDARILRSSRC